jgi:exopolysaccharide production protein ExoQ
MNPEQVNKVKYLYPLLIGILLAIISIASPWFNLTISNHEFVKSYYTFFGSGFLLIVLIYLNLQRSLNIRLNLIKVSLTLLMILGLLSTLWTVNSDLTINKSLLWVVALFGFLLATNLSLDRRSLISFSWGLILSAGIISIIGNLQFLFDPFTLTQASSPASTFGNKNIAIQPLILMFPVLFFLYISKDVQNIQVWLLSLFSPLIFTYIFYTSSRAAIISALFQLLMILFYFIFHKIKKSNWIDWNKNKRNASIFGFLLLLLLMSLSPVDFSAAVDSTVDSAKDTSSYRYLIWNVAIDMIYDSPFIGSGLGSFSHNLADGGYSTWIINNTFRVHNDILELAVELGSLGIMLFLFVLLSIIYGVFNIISKTQNELQVFYFLIFVGLSGSFINLQVSFPYQMSMQTLLFGLYCGLISSKLDHIKSPIKLLSLNVSIQLKKIIIFVFFVLFLLTFYFTYFNWIKTYNHLNKINISGEFNQLDVVETQIYHKDMQLILYNLGGQYFNNGRYTQSNAIDTQFLKYWPKHLDVLFRSAYAKHILGQNNDALQLSNTLKEIEPPGVYNSFVVQMFIYSSLNKIKKLEETFFELLSEDEDFLKLGERTYRYLIFFSLKSENLIEYTPKLYKAYLKNHSYFSCEVTNNMAIYYFNLEHYIKSSEFVNKAYEINPTCLNQKLVQLLSEKGLIEISQ